MFIRRTLIPLVALLIAILVSACSGSGTSSGSSSSSSSNNSSSYSAPAAQSTPTSATTSSSTASSSSPIVKTSSAAISGKTVTLLTNAQGMTLYYFKPDTSKSVACTGGCASTWPPLLFQGSGSPTASTKLPGELEVYPDANGKQVIYNDHPLYTFTGDTAPGQTNGNGVGGQWFVATVDLAKNK